MCEWFTDRRRACGLSSGVSDFLLALDLTDSIKAVSMPLTAGGLALKLRIPFLVQFSLVVGIYAGALVSCSPTTQGIPTSVPSNNDSNVSQTIQPTTVGPSGLRHDFASIFEAVAPSVVGLAAVDKVNGRFKVLRTGTGLIWDSKGHIVTNAHLIGDASRVRVRLMSGKVLRARVVGLDAATDVAVLSVEPTGLVPAPRGGVEDLKPGHWIAAIGNPLGMNHSITVGVVSAIGRRKLPGGGPRYADFIQSDVSIHRGNSGGPLVDVKGRVVGLNTAILGQGLSFSTRIDMVETVVERLMGEGLFVRGFAGLFVGRVSNRHAETVGLDQARGARVKGVVDGGPADRAGLKIGDVILEFGDREILDAYAFRWQVAATRPGETVDLFVARGIERIRSKLLMARSPK